MRFFKGFLGKLRLGKKRKRTCQSRPCHLPHSSPTSKNTVKKKRKMTFANERNSSLRSPDKLGSSGSWELFEKLDQIHQRVLQDNTEKLIYLEQLQDESFRNTFNLHSLGNYRSPQVAGLNTSSEARHQAKQRQVFIQKQQQLTKQQLTAQLPQQLHKQVIQPTQPLQYKTKQQPQQQPQQPQQQPQLPQQQPQLPQQQPQLPQKQPQQPQKQPQQPQKQPQQPQQQLQQPQQQPQQPDIRTDSFNLSSLFSSILPFAANAPPILLQPPNIMINPTTPKPPSTFKKASSTNTKQKNVKPKPPFLPPQNADNEKTPHSYPLSQLSNSSHSIHHRQSIQFLFKPASSSSDRNKAVKLQKLLNGLRELQDIEARLPHRDLFE